MNVYFIDSDKPTGTYSTLVSGVAPCESGISGNLYSPPLMTSQSGLYDIHIS